MWLFFFVFQIIEHHRQQQRLQLNFDHFWIIWGLFFNAFSRFLVYIISFSRQHSVVRLLVNCRINVFIICVVNKWNWNRDCKKISIHARSLSILLAKFVNSADYVSHNEISNIYISKFWIYEIRMICLKILFDRIKNMIEINSFKWNPYYLRVYTYIYLQIVSSF